jgi:rhodanese-related sulfurtransferase
MSIIDMSPDEAGRLIREHRARVLDVRTPEEYERLGHIPGADLLPVHLIASAPALLRHESRPIVVVCEHGVRSRHAVEFLARAGLAVHNMAGGMSVWRGPRERTSGTPAGPSGWLLENAALMPRGGGALDVACGAGRHALLLAAAGFEVRAVDRDADAVAFVRDTSARLGLPIEADVVDLESGAVDLGRDGFDLVLVTNYLHRPLFPALLASLRPGGLLLYETFTIHQAARGRPTNPDFLLQPGELRRLVEGLRIVREREGEVDGRMVASVAARRSGD